MSSLSQELSSLFNLFRVVETHIGPVSNDFVTLCTQNPFRWALWVAFNAVPGESIYMSTSTTNIHQNGGIPLVLGNATVIEVFQSPLLNFRDHGPLVQQTWYGGGQSTITLDFTVFEVLLITEGAQF